MAAVTTKPTLVVIPDGGRSRVVAVHECGDPAGTAIIHFHGTPGSRLELDFGGGLAADAGV